MIIDNREKRKTTIREKKDGTETRKITIGKFPVSMHKQVVEMSSAYCTVCDIYSDAIEDMRRDYDSGERIVLLCAPTDGERSQTWLRMKAFNDRSYLSKVLHGEFTDVVYTAMVRFFQKEKDRYGAIR